MKTRFINPLKGLVLKELYLYSLLLVLLQKGARATNGSSVGVDEEFLEQCSLGVNGQGESQVQVARSHQHAARIAKNTFKRASMKGTQVESLSGSKYE